MGRFTFEHMTLQVNDDLQNQRHVPSSFILSGSFLECMVQVDFFIGDVRLNTCLDTFIRGSDIFFCCVFKTNKIDDNMFFSFYVKEQPDLGFVGQVLAAGAQGAGLAGGWLLQPLVCFSHTGVGLFLAVKNLSWRGTAAGQGCPGMPETLGIRSASGLHNCEAVILMYICWHLTSVICIAPECTYSFCVTSLVHRGLLIVVSLEIYETMNLLTIIAWKSQHPWVMCHTSSMK